MNSPMFDNRTYVTDTKALLAVAEEIKKLRETIAPLVNLLVNKELEGKITEFNSTHPVEENVLLSELFKNDPVPLLLSNALARAGINTLSDFNYITRRDVKNIRNLGKKSLAQLEEFLSKYGVVLKDTCEPIPDFKVNDIVRNVVDCKTYRIDKVYNPSQKYAFRLLSFDCTSVSVLEDYNEDKGSELGIQVHRYFSPGELQIIISNN